RELKGGFCTDRAADAAILSLDPALQKRWVSPIQNFDVQQKRGRDEGDHDLHLGPIVGGVDGLHRLDSRYAGSNSFRSRNELPYFRERFFEHEFFFEIHSVPCDPARMRDCFAPSPQTFCPENPMQCHSARQGSEPMPCDRHLESGSTLTR